MMTMLNLEGKSKSELEDMLIEQKDNLLFGYKMISRGEATEAELEEEMKQVDRQIDMIEKKLKRNR